MHRIFLLSSERSGSNLIRKLVGENFNLNTPSAAQFLKGFLKYNSNINFKNKEDIKYLLKQLIALTKNHPMPWEVDFDIDALAFKAFNEKWKFLDIFDYLYAHSSKNNADGYFIKENYVFDYAQIIKEHFGSSVKFIFLVRDPRDVYASYKKVPLGPKDASNFVKMWKREQEATLSFLNTLDKTDYIVLRYEDLIEDADSSMKEISQYFNLPANDKKEFKEKTIVESPYYSNLNKSVIKDNKNNFLKELSPLEIYIIQSELNHLMDRFSYVEAVIPSVSRFKVIAYKIVFNKGLAALKKVKMQKQLFAKKEQEIREKRNIAYQNIKNYKFL